MPLVRPSPVEGLAFTALTRIREQARIQVEGLDANAPRYELLRDVEPGHGLGWLPEPSPGDLFIDFEGDPYAMGDGIEYLLGAVELPAGQSGEPSYKGLWAFDRAGEREAFRQLMALIGERRARDPGMHVYHYNHYEPTALKKLAGRYATCVDELDALLRGHVFVDLYKVVRQGLRASVESYSIKKLEPFFGFTRSVDLRDARRCLAAFEAWLEAARPMLRTTRSVMRSRDTTATTASRRCDFATGSRTDAGSWRPRGHRCRALLQSTTNPRRTSPPCSPGCRPLRVVCSTGSRRPPRSGAPPIRRATSSPTLSTGIVARTSRCGGSTSASAI